MEPPVRESRALLHFIGRGAVLVLSLLAGLVALEFFFGEQRLAALALVLLSTAGIGYAFKLRYRYWPVVFVGVLAADVGVLVLMWLAA